jgi:hypothetical protein
VIAAVRHVLVLNASMSVTNPYDATSGESTNLHRGERSWVRIFLHVSAAFIVGLVIAMFARAFPLFARFALLQDQVQFAREWESDQRDIVFLGLLFGILAALSAIVHFVPKRGLTWIFSFGAVTVFLLISAFVTNIFTEIFSLQPRGYDDDPYGPVKDSVHWTTLAFLTIGLTMVLSLRNPLPDDAEQTHAPKPDLHGFPDG